MAPAAAAPAVGGTLALYTSTTPERAAAVTAAFMKKYPQLRVDFLRAGAVEMERRIFAEMETGGIRADLLWLGDPPIYLVLRDRGQLEPYRSPEARHVPAAWKDAGGFFTAGRLSSLIIAVNPTLIPVCAAPKRWADVPRFGRTAAIPNPFFSGTV